MRIGRGNLFAAGDSGWLLARGIGAAAAIAFLILSFGHLDRFPRVHEDEPYIAASAMQLANGGTHGNPLFTGFHGAEQHVFLYPPLLPLIQSFVFRITGPGVAAMRIPSVLAGLAVLILAGILAARVRGPGCGALTMVLLVVLAAAGGVNGTSGIPLLDIARIARYDILVPVFGLSALLAFERASSRSPDSAWLWFVSGFFAGIATTAHLYGVFWLVALLAVLAVRRAGRGSEGRAGRAFPGVVRMVAGFVLALLPLAITIVSNWTEFLAQQRVVAARYDLFDPRFYIDNIINEPFRYGPFFGFDAGWSRLVLRPGLWLTGAGVVIALVHWARSGLRERQGTGFAIGLVLLVNVVLFTLLIQVKTYNYLISVWPMVVILIAAMATDRWERSRSGSQSSSSRKLSWHQIVLTVVLVALIAEGVVRIVGWRTTAARTSHYSSYMERVATHVPAGSHVLGLQQYWLGLHEFRFTSWLVPVWWNDARFTDAPIPFDAALERVAADVILVDQRMSDYFASLAEPDHPDHERWVAWQGFVERHGMQIVATVEDESYGTMHVLR